MDSDLKDKLDQYLKAEVEIQVLHVRADERYDEDFVDSFRDTVMESDIVLIIAEQLARDVFRGADRSDEIDEDIMVV